MRALTIVVLTVAVFMSLCAVPAQADNIFKELGRFLLSPAGSRPCPLPQTEYLTLSRSNRPLGEILPREVNGPGNANWALSEVLDQAGWVVIDPDARQAAQEEAGLVNANAEPAVATSFVSVQADFKDGRSWTRRHWNGDSWDEEEVCEIICVLFLKVSDSHGRTITARAQGSSWSRYTNFSYNCDRWGIEQESFQPEDEDLAFLAALVKASNQIVTRLNQAVPATQPATSQAPAVIEYCPFCRFAITIVGANYCPKCGKPLHATTDAQPLN
ncbi:MAG: hypothetical protein WC451_03935 [Patescibacteria group bacterium]|jgi:hypothetical protein